jgi:hypothetical protein
MKLREEAIQKKRARESGKNDCGGQDGNEKVEALVAQTRR